MEGGSQAGSSSSTFTSELFGSKESSSSSTGIFGSMFPPPSKVLGREALQREDAVQRQDLSKDSSKLKTEYQDGISHGSEGENLNTLNKEVNSIYQDQRVQPCHLSSSIYYGGQDVYFQPPTTQSPGLNSTFKKDIEGEDDSGSASRGNWWRGSLYY